MNLNENYWQNLTFTQEDLELIYNHLLEIETPQTITELSNFLIKQKIEEELGRRKKDLTSGGEIYLPQSTYSAGQKLIFPMRAMEGGVVASVRDGVNPDFPDLKVISVEFSPNQKAEFATNIADHKLNDPGLYENKDPNLDYDTVIQNFGLTISETLGKKLRASEDLVYIGGSYFPRSLLVDIGAGPLNLAEAVLEMAGGGPLSSPELIRQIELPTNVNAKLTEFSFNFAMQEDGRFDEVGPAGETLWFLRRLEPEEVQNCPIFLQYKGEEEQTAEESVQVSLSMDICDELESDCPDKDSTSSETISLIYPHLRAGTLPLTSRLISLFPTAYESPRIKFDFVDGKTKARFPGWVVRPYRYIYGLSEWYAEQGIIAGSLIKITRGTHPGEVIIEPENQHNSREWIRTLLVGTDGGFVFATLKQQVTCSYDERMVIMTPDFSVLDPIWDRYNKQPYPMEKIVLSIMRDLAKLNPQGHVHAEELYSAVNVVKRCPPGIILKLLFTRPWATHLGDLYFRLDESKQ